MVHPSQQRLSLASRKDRPRVTIARGERVRSFTVRPWLVALALGGVGLFAAAYLGATGYLVYRDDLLGATVARQVSIQHEYEDRIAALRAEIDRVTSRHVVETQGVEEQLAVLLDRQSLIERRQTALDELIAEAEAAGIIVASAGEPRLPRPRPSPEIAAASAGAPITNALAYAPEQGTGDDIITGTLIRGSESGSSVLLPQDVRPVLTSVTASLDETMDDQAVALDVLDAAAQAEIDRLSDALEPIGVEVSDVPDGPSGGPFIPKAENTGLHFVERAALLRSTLDDISAAKRAADAMPLRMPIRAVRVSSRFGYRTDPFLGRKALHAGVDFVAPTGTDVRATAPGIVVAAGWNGGYGHMIEIRHAGGVTTRYGHLSRILVSKGAEVAAGAIIGRVGSSGRSTGPHLHYETRHDGKAVDPSAYLAAGRALRPSF